jgi:hypothetical protein
VSAALASSTAADGHRAVTVATLMATYMQAANIPLPNAAVLHIQGTLSMANDELGWVFTSYRGERHHHANDALASGPLRPRGRQRPARSSVDGDPARCAVAGAPGPDQPGVDRLPGTGHRQRLEHRRLAQRISRLALDLLCQPADVGLHLPGSGIHYGWNDSVSRSR